jgi:hypothetical protein
MAINRQLQEEFGGAAQLRYVDFDGPELADYPEIQKKVLASELEPGMIQVAGKLLPIWDVPYSRMVKEFEAMGATRVGRKVS